jgi:hypothetical protein
MTGNMMFAELLLDGAAFLFNWYARQEGVFLPETAERLCSEIPCKSENTVYFIFAYVKSYLDINDHTVVLLPANRVSTVWLSVSKSTLTTWPSLILKKITLAERHTTSRFYLDEGCSWFMEDNAQKFLKLCQLSIEAALCAGDEQSARHRFAMMYSLRSIAEAGCGNLWPDWAKGVGVDRIGENQK